MVFDQRLGAGRLLLVGLLVSLVLPVALSGRAFADDPDSPEEWRAILIAPGAGDGEMKAVLESIAGSPSPVPSLEATLRPLLDREGPLRTESEINQHRILAFLIGYVLEPDPESGFPTTPVILADAIIDRLAEDPRLVGKVRAKLTPNLSTGRREAWARLLRHARQVLVRTDADASAAVHVEGAIWLLGHGSSDVAERMAAIAAIADNLARRASNDPALRDVPASAYLAALKSLLYHQFRGLTDSNLWFGKQSDVLVEQRDRWTKDRRAALEAFLTLIERLSLRPNADRVFAIEYGKIAVAKATKPEDLSPRFLADCSYPELREAALRRAATLSPDGSRPWVDLIVSVLDTETASIEPLLDILSQSPYQQVSEHSGLVVDAIVRRLRRRAREDAVAERTRLVDSLRVLGTIDHIQMALDDMRRVVAGGATDQEDVYAALLRKAGEVDGARVGVVVVHYFPTETGSSPTERIRQTVAEALGQKGIRINLPEAVLAAQVLRLILAGSNGGVSGELAALGVPATVASETSGPVRVVALKNLQHYPDPETVGLLKNVVLGVNTSEAEIALGTLGQILDKHSDRDAVVALVEILGTEGPSDEILALTIDALAKLPADAAPELTADVNVAIVEVIASERTDRVRLAAARAAAARQIVAALGPVTARWKETGSAEWRDAFEALLDALAGAENAPHDDIAKHLKTLGEQDPVAFAEAVDRLASLFKKSGRFAYAFMRGVLYLEQAGRPGATVADRKSDLEFAIDSFFHAGRAEDMPPAMRYRTFDSLYKANLDRARIGDPTDVEYLLKALEAAADSGDRTLAQQAKDPETGVIIEIERVNQLEPAQLDRKRNAEDRVNTITSG